MILDTVHGVMQKETMGLDLDDSELLSFDVARPVFFSHARITIAQMMVWAIFIEVFGVTEQTVRFANLGAFQGLRPTDHADEAPNILSPQFGQCSSMRMPDLLRNARRITRICPPSRRTEWRAG